ncbi:bestrophin-like domain [Streptomyces sp. NPDC002851]
MIITVTVATIAIAFVVGMVLNRLLRRRLLGEEAEAMTVRDLVEPLQTLAVLVLAFVLVMAADSFSKAEVASQTEASAVEHLYEVAEFAPPEARQRLQGDAICYARAVIAEEWRTMRDGKRSAVPDPWSVDFLEATKPLTDAPVFEMLLDADDKRGESRRDRLSQSTPAIPGAMYWFMLLTLVVTVIAVAFVLPHRRGRAEIVTLAIFTALLTAALLLINDVDRPFRGVVNVDHASMNMTIDDITKDYDSAYGKEKLPCDARGHQA